MKQFLYAVLCIAFFVVMLCFPKETLSGATNGLLLWFQIVLPTLLPYFVATNLLIQTNSIQFISKIFGPALRKLFHVSSDGSFAILAGFLCGYPIGAKVTADLVRTHRITETEGNYLLSFCNNTSPAFITSYLVIQNLKQDSLVLQTLLILYLSPTLCSFLFRWFYKAPPKHKSNSVSNHKLQFSFEILDTSIMNGFENITKVGGYIILFSILFSLGSRLPFSELFSVFEVTNGIPCIINVCTTFPKAYVLTLALTSFGGFCSIAQTKAMLGGTKLSIVKYTIEKLVTAMVTSLLALFFILQ